MTLEKYRIYDWDNRRIKTGNISDRRLQASSEPMPLEIMFAKLTDAKTGEEVIEVVAYDAIRKVVDRLLLDENGARVVNAAGDGPAIVTEFRELRIEPRE